MKRPAKQKLPAWTAVSAVKFALLALVMVATHGTAAFAGKSHADRWKHDDRRHGARHHAAPKDCTRFNGRWGYYGNPWCTPAQQRAFDRWDARRIERLRHAR